MSELKSGASRPETPRHSDGDSADDAHLKELGYEQHFERRISLWSNFALGFVYLSPLVSVVALFAQGLSQAGPPSIFWILIVGFGQLMVALVFGEIVSQFPIAGGVYQWARRLWSGRYAWLASWAYICCITIGITTTALFSADFVASLFAGTAEDPGVDLTPGGRVGIAVAVLVLCLLLNSFGSALLGRVAMIGLAAELIGVVLLGLYLLIFVRRQSVSVFFDSMGAVGSQTSVVAGFIAASAVGFFMFYGFEACGEVAEESRDPGRSIPRAMRMTVWVGGAAAFLSFAGYVLAAPDLPAILAGEDTNPIPAILQSAVGLITTKIFLLIGVTSFIAGVMSQQAAASRLVYSFARDAMFPLSAPLSQTTARSRIPLNALLAVNVMPLLLYVFVYFYPGSLFRIAAFQVLAGYVAFQMIVLAALRARVRGWRPAGPFQLGAWGLVVNVVALLFGLSGIVIMAMPTGGPDVALVDRWIALIGFLVVAAVGLLYLAIARPHLNSTAPEGDAAEVADRMRARAAERLTKAG